MREIKVGDRFKKSTKCSNSVTYIEILKLEGKYLICKDSNNYEPSRHFKCLINMFYNYIGNIYE